MVGAVADDPTARPTEIDRALDHVAESLSITAGRYTSGERARVVGCVVNRVPRDAGPETAGVLEAAGRRDPAARPAAGGRGPDQPELTWPRVADLVGELGARVLRKGDLTRRIKDVAVFAQSVPGGLDVPHRRPAGDRARRPARGGDGRLPGRRSTAPGWPPCCSPPASNPTREVWALTDAATASGLPIVMVDTTTRTRP